MSFVILGGGSVTAEYYLPALTLLGQIGQTTVVDPFERSLAPLRDKFPNARFVAQDHVSFLEGLPEGGEERVVVALPNTLHVEAVELALARGRHVLCEKPLALKAADCARLAKLAKKTGRMLKVGMSRRYLASMMLARQIVRGGELGPVISVEVVDCSQFLWRPKAFSFFAPESGGVLADMGVHYLDFLDTLVGPMSPVSYDDDARGGTESSATYQLRAGPTPVRLKISRLYSAGAFIRVVCERGEILVDKGVETGVAVTPTGAATRTVSLAQPFDDPAWPAGFHGSFCQMLVDFEHAIAGKATPIADVVDAERATALIEWAYARRQPVVPAKVEGRPCVIVTGGTGFIGGHLVERLTAGGDLDVRATVRSPSACANLARFPVEVTPTDLLDTASVAAAMTGAQTVYHLAYGKEGDAARVTIEGSKNVVEGAIAAGVECVVVLSTMYVFGFPSGDLPVDETFPYRPYGGIYGASKAEMERWCLERAKTSGATRIVVVNPTCVFGPDGGAYTTMPLDMARQGSFCWIDGGMGSCNYTYVDNVIDALLASASTLQAHGERFIINDGVTTWRAFLEPMLAPGGYAVPSYSRAELEALPRFGGPFRLRDLASAAVSSERVRDVAKRSSLVRNLFEQMGKNAQERGQNEHALTYRAADTTEAPVFPPVWLGELFSPAKASFSSDKARRILGWTPRLDLAQARAATIAWLRDTGRLPPEAD